MSKTKWNTPIIEVPDEFYYITKKGTVKSAKPTTKTNALATRNKQKAVKIETNSNIDHVKIINPGEKIVKVKKGKKGKKSTPLNKLQKLIAFDEAKKSKKNTPLNKLKKLIALDEARK